MRTRPDHLDRRQFLKLGAGAAIGAAWIYGGDIALGQIPWEEEMESVLLETEKSYALARRQVLGTGPRNNHPRVSVDLDGNVYTAWVGEREEIDRVYLASFDGEALGPELAVSAEGALAGPLAMDTAAAGVFLAWTERRDGQWVPRIARAQNGAVAASAEGAPRVYAYRPALVSDHDGARCWVAYETVDSAGGTAGIAGGLSDGSAVPDEKLVVAETDARRPALARGAGGDMWLAWDQEAGQGVRHVYIRRHDGAKWHDPIRVTHAPALNMAPAIAVDSDGRVWVAYQSNIRGEDRWDMPRWFYLRAVVDGKVHEPTSPPVAMNLDKEGTDQSFEFPRLAILANGAVMVTGRPSHSFCLQVYRGGKWSPLYRIPADGWGGRGTYLETSVAPNGDVWAARRDLNLCVLQKLTGLSAGEKQTPDLRPVAAPATLIATPVNIVRAPRRWPELKDLEGIATPLNTYYGDIHGHTNMSDGMGDVDDYYSSRRDYYEDDFGALTDHDTFVGRSLSPADYEYQKAVTEQFNKPGKYATLFAQEYTTARYPKGVGHKCIYSVNPEVPLFDHDRERYATTALLYAELKKWNCLVAPHHTGWTGTDWENFDPAVQTFAEIISNHGRFEFMGNRPIKARGGLRGHFLQDGFARGLRFGIVGSTDCHGLLWHHHAGWRRDALGTGRAGVLAPDLSRESIFEALRLRRTFGTTGNKPSIDFRVNEHVMGAEFDTRESKVAIRAALASREGIQRLVVVKNNEDWYEYGGEGYTTRMTIIDDAVASGTSWYYLRAEFDGDHMAWTSPVWVTRTT